MAILMDNRLHLELSLSSDVLVELHLKENLQTQHVRRMENGHTLCPNAGVSCVFLLGSAEGKLLQAAISIT